MVYFRLAGSPYRQEKFYKYVKLLGVTCAVWTICFIFKFFSYSFGSAALFRHDTGSPQIGLWASIWFGISSVLSDVVPLYFVLDAKFIKIFTMKHLDQIQH